MPLPRSTSFRIVDPVTLENLPTGTDGLILIGGPPQVMKGYLNNPAKTAEVIAELDGQRWYKTGDKGHVDDGFLTIVDRYSRFTKLGGEMVSLTASGTTSAANPWQCRIGTGYRQFTGR